VRAVGVVAAVKLGGRLAGAGGVGRVDKRMLLGESEVGVKLGGGRRTARRQRGERNMLWSQR